MNRITGYRVTIDTPFISGRTQEMGTYEAEIHHLRSAGMILHQPVMNCYQMQWNGIIMNMSILIGYMY